MGRFILLLAVAAGSTLVLRPENGAEQVHARTQQQALLRQALDDATATVLEAAADPIRRRWTTTLSLGRQIEAAGALVAVEEYALEESDTVLRLTLRASRDGVAQRRTSRYRIPPAGWPGPFWVDAPYAVAQVDDRATIYGGGRPAYFDTGRFTAYRLASVLSLDDLQEDFGGPLADADGSPPPLSTVATMDAVRAEFDVPRPVELAGMAISAMRSGDASLAGGTVISNQRTFGNWAQPTVADAHIVRVAGALTIAPSGHLRGTGLLLVEGDLVVRGRLQWSGLVLVRTPGQRVVVDLTDGKVEVNGGLIVDQEGPPPGGHTDLTVNRDLTGAWGGLSPQLGAIGETGPGTPGHAEYGTMARAVGLPGLFYDHEHRFDSRTPERRTVYFADRVPVTPDRHERYTWFRRALTDIAAREPGARVYVRFERASEHGAALFQLAAAGQTYAGAVGTGFGPAARPGDPFASPSFRPADLERFVVDVQSLRMLHRLTDGETPASPFWPYAGQPCPSRPLCIGYLSDRDGALGVQIVRDRDDRPLYEASVYWHTHEPGSSEYQQELATDDAWRASIRAGADYGTLLRIGKHNVFRFDESYVAGITGRLGFGASRIEHLSSVVEYVDA